MLRPWYINRLPISRRQTRQHPPQLRRRRHHRRARHGPHHRAHALLHHALGQVLFDGRVSIRIHHGRSGVVDVEFWRCFVRGGFQQGGLGLTLDAAEDGGEDGRGLRGAFAGDVDEVELRGW